MGHDENGDLLFYGLTLPGNFFIEWEPPWIILPSDISIGKTWVNKMEVSHNDYPDSTLFEHHYYAIESVNETVVIPSGTYANCIAVSHKSEEPVEKTRTHSISYYAPGVGVVLSIDKEGPGRMQRRELIKCHIQK